MRYFKLFEEFEDYDYFVRNQSSPHLDEYPYHFVYEPNLSYIYQNPTSYYEVDKIFKERGYLDEGFLPNHYDPDDFKLKDGYVCANRSDDETKPRFVGGAGSDDFVIFFYGDFIADIYDGVVVKPIKIDKIYKYNKALNKYELL